MTTSPSTHNGNAGIATWLALAASPTFTLMAWMTAIDAPPPALCAPGAGIDDMAAMYLLMSLFHLPAWLKLGSGRLRTNP